MIPDKNNYLLTYQFHLHKIVRSIILSIGYKQDYNPIHPYFYFNLNKNPDSFFYKMGSLNARLLWEGDDSQLSSSYLFIEDKHNVIRLFEDNSLYKKSSEKYHHNINISYIRS